jgi:hypothetical protein
MFGAQVVVELVAATIEAQQRCEVWSSRRPPDLGPYEPPSWRKQQRRQRRASRRGAAQMDGKQKRYAGGIAV